MWNFLLVFDTGVLLLKTGVPSENCRTLGYRFSRPVDSIIFLLQRCSLMCFTAADKVESILSSSYDRKILLHFFPDTNQKYLLIFINEILSSSINRPIRLFSKEFFVSGVFKTFF